MSAAVPFSLRVRLGQYEVEISGGREEVLKMIDDLPNLVAVVSEAFAKVGVDVRVADAQSSRDSGLAPLASPSGIYPSIHGSGNCSDAVMKLLETDWGRSTPRTLPELVEAMRVNAIHYPVTTLSGVMNWLVRKSKVKRWKTDKGYVYVLAGPNMTHSQVQAQIEAGGGQ